MKISPRGELEKRLLKSSERMHTEYYDKKHFIQDNEYSWPGDFEGRTLLALACLARALKTDEGLDELLSLAAENVNEDMYFGKLFDGKIVNEQQLSGNSWYLRALAEIWEVNKSEFALESIRKISDRFLARLIPFYEAYPASGACRKDKNKGEAIGALYAKPVNGWLLSTDTGCAFIALDGITHAYKLYPDRQLKNLIELMIEKFMSIDVVGLRCQTHATLSATRGIMRYYEISGNQKYLAYVRHIFTLYEQNGMTFDYANYNWFLRRSWTEPCAVVDSLLLSCSLFRATGEYHYAQLANRIYHNAIRFAQRGNGGFGCDCCLDEREQYLYPNRKFYEAYWCCTMRGAEGLRQCAENTAYAAQDGVYILLHNDIDAVSDEAAFKLRVETGKNNSLLLQIEKWNTELPLKIYLPDGYKNLTVSGAEGEMINGFYVIDRPVVGKIKINYLLDALVDAKNKGKICYMAGDMLLGELPESEIPDANEIFDTDRGALTRIVNMLYLDRSVSLGVRQRIVFDHV